MWEAEVARLRRGDDRVEEDTSEGSSVALETADQLCSEAEALEEKAFDMLRWKTFGSPCRVVGLATGGAPTPVTDLEFAQRFCRHIGAAPVVDSYGATEAGAITSNGRQLSEKFEDVEGACRLRRCIYAHKPWPRRDRREKSDACIRVHGFTRGNGIIFFPRAT